MKPAKPESISPPLSAGLAEQGGDQERAGRDDTGGNREEGQGLEGEDAVFVGGFHR